MLFIALSAAPAYAVPAFSLCECRTVRTVSTTYFYIRVFLKGFGDFWAVWALILVNGEVQSRRLPETFKIDFETEVF